VRGFPSANRRGTPFSLASIIGKWVLALSEAKGQDLKGPKHLALSGAKGQDLISIFSIGKKTSACHLSQSKQGEDLKKPFSPCPGTSISSNAKTTDSTQVLLPTSNAELKHIIAAMAVDLPNTESL